MSRPLRATATGKAPWRAVWIANPVVNIVEDAHPAGNFSISERIAQHFQHGLGAVGGLDNAFFIEEAQEAAPVCSEPETFGPPSSLPENDRRCSAPPCFFLLVICG
jgi:hypothetical protein